MLDRDFSKNGKIFKLGGQSGHICILPFSHLVLLLVYLLAVIEAEYSAGYRHNLSEQNHLLNYTRKGLISRCRNGQYHRYGPQSN